MNIDREKIQKAITDFLVDFGKNYGKAYAVALIHDMIDEKKEEEKGDKELRTFVPVAPELEGTVKRSSDGGSKLATKYFKVTNEWEVAVWADEKKKSETPKDVLNLWGYDVWYWSPPEKEFPKRRGGPKWVSDKDRPNCKNCSKAFSLTSRRHHCRTCGEVLCGACSSEKYSLNEIGYSQAERVCKTCYAKLKSEGLDGFKFAEEKRDVFGVQLTHSYREGIYFVVEGSEIQYKWISALRECTRYAKSPANPNRILAAAFAAAHRTAWDRQGPWYRYWRIFGTEVEMLSELLAYILQGTIVPGLIEEIKIPISDKVKDFVSKAVKEAVTTSIKTAWPKTVEEIAKKETILKEKLTPLLSPYTEARDKIKGAIRTGISDAISTVIKTCATPVLDKLLPLLFKPLLNSHVTSYKILKVMFDDLEKKVKESKTTSASNFSSQVSRTLSIMGHSKGEASLNEHIVEAELQPMEDNLRKLGKVPPFSYLSPSQVRTDMQQPIEQLIKNAFYTLQTEDDLKKELEANHPVEKLVVDLYPSIAKKYYHDSRLIVSETIHGILKTIILTPLQKAAAEVPGVSTTLERLDELIPEPLKEFISISDTFNELLDGVVDDSVNEALSGVTSSLRVLEDGFKKNSGVE